jgi:hypothetical protein
MSEIFGEDDPRRMPRHFFWGSLHIDYATAIKADISRQNYSVCPRHWYIDAVFHCPRCGNNFRFAADEQRLWYEEIGFFVDSQPKHCGACRGELRNVKALRQEYDREIGEVLQSDDCERKQRLATVIDDLCERGGDLPERIHENRKLLAKQIARGRGPEVGDK